MGQMLLGSSVAGSRGVHYGICSARRRRFGHVWVLEEARLGRRLVASVMDHDS